VENQKALIVFSLFIHFHSNNRLKKDQNKKLSYQNKSSST